MASEGGGGGNEVYFVLSMPPHPSPGETTGFFREGEGLVFVTAFKTLICSVFINFSFVPSLLRTIWFGPLS